MTIEAVLANEERWHVEVGDVDAGIAKLPDGCLQTIITSPPYWNLRSYLKPGDARKAHEIGSEKTPQEFVAKIVSVLRAARRVLRDDGTLWLNLGDSYATAGGKCFNPGGGDGSLGKTRKEAGAHPLDRGNVTDLRRWGVQDGDQMLMPHRVAFALQADGWILRSTIIWAKKSPMPESISGTRWRRCRVKVANETERAGQKYKGNTPDKGGKLNRDCIGGVWVGGPVWRDCPGCDKCRANGGYILRRGSWRPTTAHEYIFLFTKGEGYFCDGDAVQEPIANSNAQRTTAHYNTAERYGASNGGNGGLDGLASRMREGSHVTRNPRSVWTFGSEPEKAKHFATFPSALPRKCLEAATSSAGCCPKCGACYAPVVESERVATRPGVDTKCTEKKDDANQATAEALGWNRQMAFGNRDPQRHIAVTKVSGYRPTCECNAGPAIPCLVADIFSGSGTTGRVAYSMGLRYLGFELSEEYAAISREKIVRPFKKGKPTPKHKRPMDGQKELFE